MSEAEWKALRELWGIEVEAKDGRFELLLPKCSPPLSLYHATDGLDVMSPDFAGQHARFGKTFPVSRGRRRSG